MTTAINLKSVEHPFVELYPRASTGCACTEAPRGVLYHRYMLDNQKHICEAKIIPPDLTEPENDRERSPL